MRRWRYRRLWFNQIASFKSDGTTVKYMCVLVVAVLFQVIV